MFSIEAIYQQLGGRGGKGDGLTFALTDGNRIEDLLDTPHLWGHNPAVTDYIPAAGNLRQAIEDLVASATKTVDISVLYLFPTGYFREALKQGIRRAVRPGQTLRVRVTAGFYYPIQPLTDPIAEIDRFIRDINAPPEVIVYVAAMQTWATSWNHSKLIIADGFRAVSGGHNLWSDDYTQFAPVHDVSLRFSGPSAKIGEAFINRIWERMWHPEPAPGELSRKPLFWSRRSHNGLIAPSELVNFDATGPYQPGPTRMLSLARMGLNLEPVYPVVPSDNASEVAKIMAVQMSDRHIRMSQQMLGGSPLGVYDDALFAALCRHIIANKELSLIISDTGATTVTHDSYSGDGVEATAKHFAQTIRQMTGMPNEHLVALLTKNLHIGPLRFYDRQPGDPAAKSWMWRNGAEAIEPANHAKVYIIDENGFYFGSDNAYAMPSNPFGMQEFGFLVSGASETDWLLQNYWAKAWHYSAQFEFKDWSRVVGETSEDAVPALSVRPT